MSTERIDPVSKSYTCIDRMADAGVAQLFDDGELAVKAGQVYATLALVEAQQKANEIAERAVDQQRIANVIHLLSMPPKDYERLRLNTDVVSIQEALGLS